MKTHIRTVMVFLLAGLLAFSSFSLRGQDLTAGEIIRRADEKFNGEESGVSSMSMTIIRPTWERTVTFKSWVKEPDYALTLITAPASEKGQSFLKRGTEMWSWNPSISRLIKLPPAMMSQGWMGSDYTNDDILKESSVVDDYEHQIVGDSMIGERNCYKILLTAKDDAPVIWGHQVRWIDKKDFLFLKAELYDEFGYLVRTETASDIRVMNDRLIPTRIEMVPEDDPGHKTIVEIVEIKFNEEIPDSFFSQQNMKRLR